MKEKHPYELFTYRLQSHKLYIALDGVNFDFMLKEVEKCDFLFKEGHEISDIAKYIKRPELEIFLLYLDRVMKGKIKPIYTIKRLKT